MANKYNRKAKKFTEQIAILKQRGLELYKTEEKNKQVLANMNYFMIYHFAELLNIYDSSAKKFNKGSTLKEIYSFYLKDIQLKNIIFDAINLLEKHLRSFFTCVFCCENKVASSLDIIKDANILFDKPKRKDFDDAHDILSNCLQNLLKQYNREKQFLKSKPNFYHSDKILAFYFDLYKTDLPFWVLAEYLDFGKLIFLVSNTKNQFVKEQIRDHFSVDSFPTFTHSIMTIKEIRNLIAHYHPLLGSRISYFSKINNKIEPTYINYQNNTSIFSFILLLIKLLKSCGFDQVAYFKSEIVNLLDKNSKVLKIIEAPENWAELLK